MAEVKLIQSFDIELRLNKEEAYFLLTALGAMDADGLRSVEDSLRMALKQGSNTPSEVELKYPCEFCDRIFATKHAVGTHKAKTHKGQIQKPELIREGVNNGNQNH